MNVTSPALQDAPLRAGRNLTILMYPARRQSNAYNGTLCDSLQRLDTRVLDYSPVRAITAHYDVLHIHWPEWFAVGSSPLALTKSIIKGLIFFGSVLARRKPVVWTVHNLEPHQPYSSFLLRVVGLLLRRVVKIMIMLSLGTRDELTARRHPCRELPAVVIPHGTYSVSVDDRSVSELREELALASDDHVIAFAGSLQPYKGVDLLIEAFRSLREDHMRLLIAGPGRDAARYVRDLKLAAMRDSRVTLDIGRLSATRLESIMRIADLVVLPYRPGSVLNSGSAIHALCVGTPVMLPATPTFHDLAHHVGPEWVRLYDDLDREEIRAALSSKPGGEPDLSHYSDWSRIAQLTARAYLTALGRHLRGGAS